ncbi:TPA: ATP-binding protein [Candidatus Woesearchaeota archaeon]|nr:ATP-binding protein [Candidatus Woesearchaeota archaeon]
MAPSERPSVRIDGHPLRRETMERHEFYILTGGPCSGKTTTAGELARMGYDTVPESARDVIAEEQGKEQPVLPWTDLLGFQHKVFAKQMDLEARANGKPTILDRSVIDNLAYCELGGLGMQYDMLDYSVASLLLGNYRKVFLLDPVPYKQDAERREDAQEASRIHDAIGDIYKRLHCDIVKVPVMESATARAEYIDRIIREVG